MSAALDRAMHAHMGHGAMACGDPLTECLCDELAPPPELLVPDDAAAQPLGMWDMERAHPWGWALAYGVVMLAAMLAMHGSAAGWW